MIKIKPYVHAEILKITGVLLVILFAFNQKLSAQRKYGNEWINYSQTYYKLKTVQSGMYRVTYTDLKNAGMNVSSLDPTHLQLFFRGVETAVYVSSGSKTSFGTSDYIEFYGQGNDGALDSVLYLNPSYDINKSYSMYTDTAAYFLTVGTAVSKMHYTYTDKNYGNNPAPNYMCEQDTNLHVAYYDGVPINSSLNFTGSDYTSGEGWMGNPITCYNYGTPASITYNINLNNSFVPSDTTNLAKPVLEILVYGKSDVATQAPDHHLQIFLNPGKVAVWESTFDGFQTIHKFIRRNWSDVYGKSQVGYVVQAGGVNPGPGGSTSDELVASFLRLHYLNAFNINPNSPNLTFNYQNNNSGSSETDFDFTASTAPSTTKNLALYDITNHVRTQTHTLTSKSILFAIDNFNNNARYILFDTTKALKALSINQVNFTKPDYSQNYNYIIITNKTFAQGAQAFAAYKSTQLIDSVNSFKPLIVYSDDLYDQFFYGLHHPAALQNFMAFMYNNAPQQPQYLLLLGKGIDNADVRNYASSDYVPSIGYPPSDVMFTSEINIGFQGAEKVIDPKMGIGRLQILSNNDIMIYLNKLRQYDSSLTTEKSYLKTAINVDGGDAVDGQIIQIRNFMDGEAKVLSNPYSGLKVNSYYSVTNTAVNSDLKTQIQQNIQSGTSLFSYLAHGSAEQLQVDFADTTTLTNKGKYPIMYVNGCNIGNAFLPPNVPTYARFYTLAPNKGSIIWMSHSNQALDNVMYSQMGAFFNNIAVSNYGKSVGSCWHKTITDLKSYDADSDYRALIYEWVLQGDPSVRFPYQSKPDYAIHDSSLFMATQGVIASSASYQIGIPVVNYGKTNPSPLKIEVKQTFPDNSVITYDSIMPSVNYLDTFYFTINRNNLNVQGINKFDVYVNADSAVNEISYGNNHASFTYYFQGNGVRALFPNDYYIVNSDTPALISQSRNLIDYTTGMYFEIDTTTRFNSPLKQTSPLLKGSSLITWKPKLNNTDANGRLIDSTVYYWRTRMNLPADTGGEWNIQSFIYLKNGKPGWSQSNWGQYSNIVPDLINLDTVDRKMSYPPKYQGYTLNQAAFRTGNVGIKPDNGLIYTKGTGAVTLLMVEVDKNTLNPITFNRLTGKPLVIYNYTTGGVTYPVVPVNYQQFDMTNQAYQDTFAMEINAVPDGNYILITSSPNGGASRIVGLQEIYNYKSSVLQAFDKIGDTIIRKLNKIKRDSLAFVMEGAKGSVKGKLLAEQYKFDNYAKWISGNDPGDTVMIDSALTGTLLDSASIISEKIGPASSWHTVHQNYRSLEYPTADQGYMSIIGINSNGSDTVLYQNIKSDSFDISNINASKFPYIKLQSFLNDTLNWTPPQLRLWQANYDGIPEGTLAGDSQSVYPKNIYAQGDSIHVKIKFQNVSNLPMTKVLVNFTMKDAQSNTRLIDSEYFKPLNPGEFFWIDKKFSVSGLTGSNSLNIFVNPGYQQPEQTLDNNFVQFPFEVVTDRINPIMDVTFDGLHIVDGQIISPDPEIITSVKDENKILILNDTSDYKVSLQYPDSAKPENIYFSNPKVSFIPGDSANNDAMIRFKPGPLADGIYLFNVQATDVTGNLSGPIPYSIHFRIINNPAISNCYMYPNPLTDVSRFGFTITGDIIPQNIDIKIFDVTGRCVRTLNLNQSGNIRAGVNEISWDGTDNNGAVLNQGIYFYKVIIGSSNNQLAHYPLPDDWQLQTGFNKIIILRGQ